MDVTCKLNRYSERGRQDYECTLDKPVFVICSKALFTRNVCVCVNVNVNVCINFYTVLMVMQTHAENRSEPILCVCICITIHSIQNYDVEAHANLRVNRA